MTKRFRWMDMIEPKNGVGSTGTVEFRRERNARYDRLRSCLGKKQYATQNQADLIARKERLFPYKCRCCDFWHLGNKRID